MSAEIRFFSRTYLLSTDATEEEKPLKWGSKEGEIFSMQISFFKKDFTGTYRTLQQMRQNLEELVAEIGSAFLCAFLGITPETREDHAAYIQSWLTVLKKDNRAIFTAASQAQRAVDYLRGLSTSLES